MARELRAARRQFYLCKHKNLAVPDDVLELYRHNIQFFQVEEIFKVRFKGLVSEEDPGFAVVGLTVCDSDGNIIVKIQKRVPPAGKEVLEATALVEGLRAALSKGITRVHAFTDSVPLYNYMTRRWPVEEQHGLETITQAKLLQKKFKECNIYVVLQSQKQRVISLAKDVIDFHIKENKKNDENQESKETFTICLKECDSSSFFIIDDCYHQFCFSCMRKHVEVQLLRGVSPECLNAYCKIKLDVESCKTSYHLN